MASVGPGLAAELGLVSPSIAAESPERLLFGDREPLARLMEDTPAEKLLPILVEKYKDGTTLEELVAAGALANARMFGGLDYEGHHAFNSLLPSLQMSRELPADHRALPVLKVLHRNTSCMQGGGGSSHEQLHPVVPAKLPNGRPGQDLLRDAIRAQSYEVSESTMAALIHQPLGDAYNDLQHSLYDGIDVHRIVIAWRAWATIDVVGQENALTLLRQSIRFCVRVQEGKIQTNIRTVLPELMERHQFFGKSPGNRRATDAWVEELSSTLYNATPKEAAAAAANALAEGFAPEDIGEAISLAANRLVLCDAGRTNKQASREAPVGSVHGNSIGVHASDAINAWRNIVRTASPRHIFAGLIVAAFQSTVRPEHDGPLREEPLPDGAELQKAAAKDAAMLLTETDDAIRAGDQAGAAALVHRYGELKLPERPVFDLLLRYACSEDGSMHAEKYYRTVVEEFATTRPAFRWRQLVGLARVTASEYGHPAPGYAEAVDLLKV